MDQNEAYNLGVAFGKKVGCRIPSPSDDTVEAFIKSGRALCGTKIFAKDHPFAHVEHDDETKAAFHRGEQEGLRQAFSLPRPRI